MELALLALIHYHANINGIDPNVAVAVAKVESGFKVNAVGSKNERSIYQLLPSSFPEYTIEQLSDPKINISLGIKHLAYSKQKCNHMGKITWVICYNRGVAGGKKVKNPIEDGYVKKVIRENNNLVYKEKLDVYQDYLRINRPGHKRTALRW